MSDQERWDVALKVLNGPLAGAGEQVVRGPVVRIGADPGPGGLKLGGYRGLDARQCVITAYTGGTAAVAAVGTNQVRLAPHPNVAWADIDPITGPVYLTPGCAVHLGPVGRGATIEFVACRRLGAWQTGVLASERADAGGGPVGTVGRVPAAYDVRRVGSIASSTAPVWFVGCTFLMASTTAGVMLLVGLAWWTHEEFEPLGPIAEGYEFYDSVDLAQTPLDPGLREGLQQPYYKFVMEPNITAAHAQGKRWEEPSNWDAKFYDFVTASAERHVESWAFFSRLEAVRVEYGKVVTALRRAQLPEVFAAIPYQESRYNASMPSEVCADGYWQFMPETAFRLSSREGLPFEVSGCKFVGVRGSSWTPSELAPPPNARLNAPYMDDGRCMIERCDRDDRKNLDLSTDAAMFTLREAWTDPVIAQSGSAVQLTITSHNAGYDDGRFGEKYKKRFNVKPAFQAFLQRAGPDAGRSFVGQNIRCRTAAERATCDAAFLAETQHYAYTIVAQHFLAVCYYAKNYAEEAAFGPWTPFVASDGYCNRFDVPTREEVKSHRRAP
ncbi:MAG: transglycosylase SLT domain-containing protein [Myxococcota bacterium]